MKNFTTLLKTRRLVKFVYAAGFVGLLLTVVISLTGGVVLAAPQAATSPTLGAAGSFSVLAGETVTNTGSTIISGDLGVSPGSAVTGFPPGIVNGAIYAADTVAADAQAANTAAFTYLDQGCDTTYPTGNVDLIGLDLIPGVYCADSFTLTGTLTLSGSGVWIFKSSDSLITSGEANIVGGNPCDVWWRVVSSATLGTNTSLIGNILADTSVSMATGASLNGRAFARTGSVTLDNNSITGDTCLVQPEVTATPTIAPTTTSPTATLLPIVTATPTIASTTTSPTATLLPIVTALPPTGGAPIRSEAFPWSMVMVAGIGIVGFVLFLGMRAFRSTDRPKQ